MGEQMASRLGDGGPAFSGGLYEHAHAGKNDRSPYNAGMSLRDYFAAQALAGFTAMDVQSNTITAAGGSEAFIKLVAKSAYKYADAMLAERDSPNGS